MDNKRKRAIDELAHEPRHKQQSSSSRIFIQIIQTSGQHWTVEVPKGFANGRNTVRDLKEWYSSQSPPPKCSPHDIVFTHLGRPMPDDLKLSCFNFRVQNTIFSCRKEKKTNQEVVADYWSNASIKKRKKESRRQAEGYLTWVPKTKFVQQYLQQVLEGTPQEGKEHVLFFKKAKTDVIMTRTELECLEVGEWLDDKVLCCIVQQGISVRVWAGNRDLSSSCGSNARQNAKSA